MRRVAIADLRIHLQLNQVQLSRLLVQQTQYHAHRVLMG